MIPQNDILISTEWLAIHLEDSDLVILDATRHLPKAKRDAQDEFAAGHIPRAQFLDLKSFTDEGSAVPASLPNSAQVEARLKALGVIDHNRIVIYDDSAVKTSARAWFALRAHWRGRVAILDGGIAKWRSEGRPLESGAATQLACDVQQGSKPSRVRTKSEMITNCETQAEQVVDARSADRVFGSGDDPVHGGTNGRIPGSFNVPFNSLFEADGTFKSPADLTAAFERAGVDLSRPIITTCGSGVTASVLLFALELIGKTDTALYDGSWAEWSADPDTPKVVGPE